MEARIRLAKRRGHAVSPRAALRPVGDSESPAAAGPRHDGSRADRGVRLTVSRAEARGKPTEAGAAAGIEGRPVRADVYYIGTHREVPRRGHADCTRARRWHSDIRLSRLTYSLSSSMFVG